MPFPIAEFREGEPVRLRLVNRLGHSFECALIIDDVDEAAGLTLERSHSLLTLTIIGRVIVEEGWKPE